MRRSGLLRALLAAAALALAPVLAFALEEQSLLTPDGMLHVLRSGTRSTSASRKPRPKASSSSTRAARRMAESRWRSCRARSPIRRSAVSSSATTKKRARCSCSGRRTSRRTRTSASASSATGVWTNSALLPSQGISRAYNPEMRVTHQRVTYLDANDAGRRQDQLHRFGRLVGRSHVVPGAPRDPVPGRDGLRSGEPRGLRPAHADRWHRRRDVRRSALGRLPLPEAPGGRSLGRDPRELRRLARRPPQRGPASASRTSRASPRKKGTLEWKRRHTPIVGIAADGPIARMAPRLMPHDPGQGRRDLHRRRLQAHDVLARRELAEVHPPRRRRVGARSRRHDRRVHDVRQGARPRHRHGQPPLRTSLRESPGSASHRPAARPGAGSTAGLIPAIRFAPAARTSSLPSVGRLPPCFARRSLLLGVDLRWSGPRAAS